MFIQPISSAMMTRMLGGSAAAKAGRYMSIAAMASTLSRDVLCIGPFL